MTIQDMLKSLEKLPDRSDLIKRRDFFAGLALAGILADPHNDNYDMPFVHLAYHYADEMEVERVKSE